MPALLELTIQTTAFSQRFINRYNYYTEELPPVGGHSFGLANAFGAIPAAGVYPITKPVARHSQAVSASVSFDQFIAKDLYSVTDFFEVAFLTALAGLRVGESAAPFVAFGLRTNRVRSDIKRGTKRFGTISETDTAAGGTLNATYVSGPIQALADALSAALTWNDGTGDYTYRPCVLARQKYTPDPAHPERVAYKYYPTFAEQLSHAAQNVVWSPYETQRSQTSRQYGRGI